MFKCSICGREITFQELAFIKQKLIICKECFPKYYVKHLCPLIKKRISGKNPISCMYCSYVKECDEYINELKKVSSEEL